MSADEKLDSFPNYVVEAIKSKDAEIQRLRAERQDTFLSIFRDFVNLLYHPAAMIIVACVWLMIWVVNQLPTEVNQPRVYLDPAHKYNVTITSTAEQLFSLQSQLEIRMTQHNVVMSQNLDNFTNILTDITADADLAADYIQFLFKIIDLGAGRTVEDWQGDADMLNKESKKLGNVALSDEIRKKVEAVTHIAGTIAAEMADMEHFLRDTSSASNILLNRLGHVLGDELADYNLGHMGEEPRLQQPILDPSISDLNAPVAQLQPGETMQWSWDSINKFGDVRRTTGDFTPAQQAIIEKLLQKMNSTGTLLLPATIRYGIGLPDAYPQDLSSLHKKLKLITYRGLSVLDPTLGEEYKCDIVAYFAKDKSAATQKMGEAVLQEVPERELIGVQSLECASEGEEMRDVVREKVTAKKEKKQKEKRVKLAGY